MDEETTIKIGADPWYSARDGFVIGEGAGILILEELEFAQRRGAKIVAEVLGLLVEGLGKKQIADRLFVSFNTIDKHVRNVYGKLEVQTRGSAVAKVLKERLL